MNMKGGLGRGLFPGRGRPVALWLALAASFAGAVVWAETPKVYYRYVNDQGVQVVGHAIPPQYSQKGYEIVSVSGDVIKVVPPALSAEELARKEAEEKLREEYQRLNRRYSSMADIELAKQRKLENIETNIAIVRGNIQGLEAQIETLTSQAADVERAGRQVPDSLLEKLKGTQAELAGAIELLSAREREYDAAAARFDIEIEIYAKGRELAADRRQ